MRAKILVADPVRRALFQHDLWAVFDWTVSHFESNAAARHALATRLARAIRRLALPPEEMPQLVMAPPAAGPRLDTYASAVKSARYPAQCDPTHRERAFLPPDLFEPAGPWVPIQGNSPLPQHADELSRSWFSVFLSVPGGRGATLAYLKMLWDSPQPFVVDAAASFSSCACSTRRSRPTREAAFAAPTTTRTFSNSCWIVRGSSQMRRQDCMP